MHGTRAARPLRIAAALFCLLAWGTSAAASQQSRHTLGLPGTGWHVALDVPGFEVTGEQTRSDGEGKMFEAAHAGSGMMLSLFVEREPAQNGTQACRELYWNRMREAGHPMRDVRTTEQPPLSVVHYLIPSFQGRRVMHQNANAYYGRDGVCVDLHLSKPGYVAADSALFQAVLRGVRIQDAEAPAAGTPGPPPLETARSEALQGTSRKP